jgi:hypothetical protein
MTKTPKRPRDANQLAKSVVDLATMDEEERSKATAAAEKAKRKADQKKS